MTYEMLNHQTIHTGLHRLAFHVPGACSGLIREFECLRSESGKWEIRKLVGGRIETMGTYRLLKDCKAIALRVLNGSK